MYNSNDCSRYRRCVYRARTRESGGVWAWHFNEKLSNLLQRIKYARLLISLGTHLDEGRTYDLLVIFRFECGENTCRKSLPFIWVVHLIREIPDGKCFVVISVAHRITWVTTITDLLSGLYGRSGNKNHVTMSMVAVLLIRDLVFCAALDSR